MPSTQQQVPSQDFVAQGVTEEMDVPESPASASAPVASSSNASVYSQRRQQLPSGPPSQHRLSQHTQEGAPAHAGWANFASSITSPAPSWRGHTHGPGFPLPHGQHTPGLAFTPSSERRDPFASYTHSQAPRSPGGSQRGTVSDSSSQALGAENPFGMSTSGMSLSHSASSNAIRKRHIFKSHLLQEGAEVHKPWLESRPRKRADRKAYWVFVAACILGLLAAGGVVFTGIASLPKYSYCLVMQDDFSGTELNRNVWFHDQQVGGFGTGEFEWTSDSSNNSYVKDGSLYIVPTLTSDSLGDAAITNNGVLNLTAINKCTASNTSDATACWSSSNATLGTVLPPVQSARLITNFSTTIKYGRIEVRARMPTGDWIWPAIWMMPKDSVYGDWPRSGEIDIFESKGNAVTKQNSDTANRMHSSLHWGLSSSTDRYLETTKDRQLYRNYYDQEFHTFGLEWTPKGIYTWEQSPIHKVLAYEWDTDFYTKGTFPSTSDNGTALSNPWPKTDKAAPFDQEFFLILSVAVGGTNGYFSDADMPWSNSAKNPRSDFWEAKDTWYPTWPQKLEDRAMVVDYVKMYQLEGEEGKACPAAPLIA